MLYDEQSGHDALLESIEIDAVKNAVSIKLLAYPELNASQRFPIEITFSDVTCVTTQADFIRLAENRCAGTVNHWHIAKGPGTSYFYLIEGFLSVTSNSVPELVELTDVCF